MSNWYIYNKKADFGAIADKYNITPMTARILRNRDICTEEEIKEYLYGDLSYLYNPFLMNGIRDACEIILSAIKNKEKIRIMGDYDIDGVCSSYILKTFILSIGGDVSIDIPDRIIDGYGLSARMVENAASDDISLIITCDNGISASDSIKLAKEKNIKVIVTDHHEIPEVLPDADVIIDPHMSCDKYPFKELCGAGVAFKLSYAMAALTNGISVKDNCFSDSLFDELLMFTGFATVGDIVPLVGENRIFVKEGLKRLRTTNNVGMNALINVRQLSKESLEAFHIGFVLGPCINSAGRLKNAKLALNLLEAKKKEEADNNAAELSKLNEERKKLTDIQVEKALSLTKGSRDKIIIADLNDAHESVIGIVAGRLKEEFNRPVIVLTSTETGVKGSGRSVENYNIIEGISRQSGLFEKFGGHAKACGFTLKKGVTACDLRNNLNRDCELEPEQLEEKKWIDMQLPFEFVSAGFAEELDILSPFGVGNPRPLFAEKNINVVKSQILGKEENVLKLSLQNEKGTCMEGIMFGSQEKIKAVSDSIYSKAEKSGTVKIMFTYIPKINEFRGRRTMQALIDDIIIQ